MSELGDLLELLHGARGRWSTVRLVVSCWSHSLRWEQARDRWMEEVHRQGGSAQTLRAVSGSGGLAGEVPETREWQLRLWLDRARDRVRSERSMDGDQSFSVRVGDRWWSYHPSVGATSNEGSDVRLGRSDEVTVLLDPSLVLPVLDLEPAGAREVAGRPGVVVRAVRREVDVSSGPMGHLLPGGASEFELVADAERGVLLRLEARVAEGPFMVQELVDVGFDEAFDYQVFVFRPPPGEPVRSHAELSAMPEAMSLEEVARHAPFTVLAPTRVPAGWRVDALWFAGRERPPAKPSVVLHCVDPTHLHRLHITQSTEEIPDALDWERVEHEGALCWVWAAPGPGGGQIDIKLESHGTHVRMGGNLERSVLLDIAASLRPAPRELPPLVTEQ